MTDAIESDVTIVGAGPVGLTLALDLAKRGAKVAVVEIRRPAEPPSVKCNHVSARSMEIFRRLGIAADVRAAGLPADFPNDIVFRTTFTGPEMARIPIPGRSTRYTDKSGPDGWWPTPEPPHRINQIFLEPILFAHAAAHPNIRILNRAEVTGFDQDADSVTAQARDLDTGEALVLASRYLVGCDGGRSAIRKAIGAAFRGDAVIQRVQSTHIRAPDLLGRLRSGPGWFTYNYNPTRPGTVIAIDGVQDWLIHCYLMPHEAGFESIDRDRQIRTILGVDDAFEYQVVSKEDWVGRRLVADKFRDRRVFICGDAAHIWVPYAGYGMNAGIADAMNLSWLLAAHLEGWAPEAILDAYEAERAPITEQVSRFAMDHAAKAIRERNTLPACIEDDTPQGAAARAEVGAKAYALNVEQFCCAGLNFGYYYDASPLIAYDAGVAPAYSMGDYTPSTAPGCRAPHVWLADGRSLYDALGPGYTLLRFDPDIDVSAIQDAAGVRGLPLEVLDVVATGADADAYDQPLVLMRPDQHIAWRGAAPPKDALSLVDTLRGAGAPAQRRRLMGDSEPVIDDSLLALPTSGSTPLEQ